MAARRRVDLLALRSLTCAFATATVMPLPICAGVLGMARTIGWRGGNAASSVASRTPAAMETITVCGPASGATCRQRLGHGLRLHREHDAS